jgi:hypothetical protein
VRTSGAPATDMVSPAPEVVDVKRVLTLLGLVLAVLLFAVAACASPSALRPEAACQTARPGWLQQGAVKVADVGTMTAWADATVAVVHFCDPQMGPDRVPPVRAGRHKIAADFVTSRQGPEGETLEAVYPLPTSIVEEGRLWVGDNPLDTSGLVDQPDWCTSGQFDTKLPPDMSVQRCGSLLHLEWEIRRIPKAIRGSQKRIVAEVGVVTPTRSTPLQAPIPAGTRVSTQTGTMRVATGIPLNEWALTRCLELTLAHLDIVGMQESPDVQAWAMSQRSRPVCLRMS